LQKSRVRSRAGRLRRRRAKGAGLKGLHVIERFKILDGGKALEVLITVEDRGRSPPRGRWFSASGWSESVETTDF
jgi:hypothetical protein